MEETSQQESTFAQGTTNHKHGVFAVGPGSSCPGSLFSSYLEAREEGKKKDPGNESELPVVRAVSALTSLYEVKMNQLFLDLLCFLKQVNNRAHVRINRTAPPPITIVVSTEVSATKQ